jgi:hypothetical protein
MKFIQSGTNVQLLTAAISILEQDSEDGNDDGGWQGLHSLMRDKPLWKSSTPHIYILTVSNRREGALSGILNYVYQTQLVLKLILSATGPPTSLEGRDDHEMYCDK